MKLYNASIILFYAAFVMPIILIMYIAAAIMDFAAFLIDSICSICLSISNAIYSSIKLIDSTNTRKAINSYPETNRQRMRKPHQNSKPTTN